MCDHCGCRGVEPIAELMDEHLALLDLEGEVRRQVAADDRVGAMATVMRLTDLLLAHVAREEAGIFAALKEQGDFGEAVAELEGEHRTLDVELDELDPDSPEFVQDLTRMLDELVVHIDKEDQGIFPVSVVTLGARGWATVEGAHAAAPSFLVAQA